MYVPYILCDSSSPRKIRRRSDISEIKIKTEDPKFQKHKQQEVLYLQTMIPPKGFDIFPPDWGMLRRSRCVQNFL